MKQVRGFWLPDWEQHLVSFLKREPGYANGPTYQIAKYKAALEHVKSRRTAVDVGAHCGLWSRVMAHDFATVEAFEPVTAHLECLKRNIQQFNLVNVNVHAHALGEENKRVTLHTGPTSTGDTYVKAGGEHSAEMLRLDDFVLRDVDFVKIDCEGFEYHVLKGGERTIRRDKPCIIVEQKPGKAAQFGLPDTEAVTLLQTWGATLHGVIKGDFILSWV